jgi:hypothetical protein
MLTPLPHAASLSTIDAKATAIVHFKKLSLNYNNKEALT